MERDLNICSSYPLKDLSFLLPVHIDSAERLEHFFFLYHFLFQHFPHSPLFLIEEGYEPKLSSFSKAFVPKKGFFSPAKICNLGASLIQTPFFCKWDVDALIQPEAIVQGLEKLQKSMRAMLLPFSGLSLTVQNPLRKEILRSLEWQKLAKSQDVYVKNPSSTGLIHLFHTETFKKYGGYNEEFLGWGHEDDEAVFRFSKLAGEVQYLEGFSAFHFDHPRIPQDPLQAERNRLKSHLVRQMDREELLEYISSWNPFT